MRFDNQGRHCSQMGQGLFEVVYYLVFMTSKKYLYLKLRYCEKGARSEKKSPIFYYLVTWKQSALFFQIFVRFSEYLNLILFHFTKAFWWFSIFKKRNKIHNLKKSSIIRIFMPFHNGFSSVVSTEQVWFNKWPLDDSAQCVDSMGLVLFSDGT